MSEEDYLKNFMEYLGLDNEEINFFSKARSQNGGGAIHTNRTLGELDAAKKLRMMVDDLIKSNERLSITQGRYALALNILTAALVFVGLLNLFST